MDFESEFVEVRFADAETATRAERSFPFFITSGEALAMRERDWAVHGDGIEAALKAAGIAYEVGESSLSEDDMWPAEAGDDHEDDAGFAAPGM